MSEYMPPTVGITLCASHPAPVGVDASTGARTRAERARVGIWTADDLRSRCHVDADTGCWNWRGATHSHGRPCLWFGPIYRSTSLGYVLAYLSTSRKPSKNVAWRPTCQTPYCANPAHNKAAKRSSFTPNTGPSSVARTKFAATILAKTKLGADAIAEIRTRAKTAKEYAAQFDISPSYVRRIWQGKARTVVTAGYSVFSWQGANK